MKLFQRTLLFFLLVGITRSNSKQFLYYWKLDVADLTQFQFAMLSLIGNVFFLIGILIYSIWMKHMETRTLLLLSLVLDLISNLFNIALT